MTIFQYCLKKVFLFCVDGIIAINILSPIWIQIVCNHLQRVYKIVLGYIFNLKMEPEKYKSWISVSTMDKENNYDLEEVYLWNDKHTVTIEAIYDLVIMKTEDGRRGSWVTNGKHELTTNKVKLPFLTIKYRHPHLKRDIYIDLEDDYYYAGNEILSAAFVKRWLLYNELDKTVPFDEFYWLELFDAKNLEIVFLNFIQYVQLRDKDYEIVNKI